MVILYLHYKNGTITETNSTIVYGLAPDLWMQEGDFIASVEGSGGETFRKFGISDPTRVSGEESGVGGGSRGPASIPPVEEADFTIILPFSTSMQKLVVSNASTGQAVFSTDLSRKVYDFCQANPADADCVRAPPPKPGFQICGLTIALAALAAFACFKD